jgi:hypothetical protein
LSRIPLTTETARMAQHITAPKTQNSKSTCGEFLSVQGRLRNFPLEARQENPEPNKSSEKRKTEMA